MKKIIPLILIALILVNTLAPFSFGVGKKNNIVVRGNTAEAVDTPVTITMTPHVDVTSNSITVSAIVCGTYFNPKSSGNFTNVAGARLYGSSSTTSGMSLAYQDPISWGSDITYNGDICKSGSITFKGKGDYSTPFSDIEMQPNTTYYLEIIAASSDEKDTPQSSDDATAEYGWGTVQKNIPQLAIENFGTLTTSKTTLVAPDNHINYVISSAKIKTNPDDKTAAQSIGEAIPVDTMPPCGIIPGQDGKLSGCIAQGLYYLFFVPTSFLFALAGTFFDYTFAYSVTSSSYNGAFVTEGWGIVRDFCNMFFIFILLYVAFKTILGIDSSKTKEMIINVVIIGILINFSLFATKLIIDTSNILARVFYNSDMIITKDDNGTVVSTPGLTVGADGVIPLSSAIVNDVNPQNIIIKADRVGKIKYKDAGQGGANAAGAPTNGVSVGTFIIVTLLASAFNVVGFIVFLSVGLLFVLRVVSLWVAMIFAPLAFFSYAAPGMQDLEMVGWKKWWPETIKVAFLAPMFIFFIFLILKFLKSGLGMVSADAEDGLGFVISIVVPFAILMGLLVKAKGIAVKWSGDMGAAVSKIGGTIGGAALGMAGGAALGGLAMAGRQAIGRPMNALANSTFGKKWASSGLPGSKIATSLAKNSFDFRDTSAGKNFQGMMQKQLGANLNAGSGVLSALDLEAKKGGIAGALERDTKRKDAYQKAGEPMPLIGAKKKEADDEAAKYKEDYEKAEQDERARLGDKFSGVKFRKEYETKYRLEAERSERLAQGTSFDQDKFNSEYEKKYGSKSKNAAERDKEALTDRANDLEYGSGYKERKQAAKNQAKKDNKEFNEVEWRKNQRKRTLSDAEATEVMDLRKRGTREKMPVVGKEKLQAEKAIKQSDEELAKILKKLTEVVDEVNIGKDPNDHVTVDTIKKEHIDEYIKPRSNDIINYEAEITGIKSQMGQPNVSAAQMSDLTNKLTIAMRGKKTTQDEIEWVKSLRSEKEKQASIKESAEEKVLNGK